MYLLGYDLGSSHIKVSLVHAESHDHVATVRFPEREMEILSRQKGWAEQQPELWWRNVCKATKKILAQTKIKPDQISAIGISYQMHGLVLVDKENNVIRPSIIWCDSRAVGIGDQAFKELGHTFCLNNYLNSPGNFTASKLKWIKDHEPDKYRQIDKILLPGEYIALKFTGNKYGSIAGLSEGVFWNFKERRVAHELLNYYELTDKVLPDIKGTFELVGELSKTAARESGLKKGIPISYRAGDQPNNALSLNVLKKGELAATSGTSGVVYGIVDQLLFDPESRINAFAHVNYEHDFKNIGILLCINGAGIQYAWMKQQIARTGRSYQDMERMANSIPIGSEGICLLPFGNGAERIFNNANIDAHIHNLDFNRHSRAHMYRASLEGVAFSFVHGINLLKEIGLKVDSLRVANDNMFRSAVFSETIASLLKTNIEIVNTTGAIGAARAAGVGIGVYKNAEDALSSVSADFIYEGNLNQAAASQAYNNWSSKLNDRLFKQSTLSVNEIIQIQELKKTLNKSSKELKVKALLLDEKDRLLNEISAILEKDQGDSELPASLSKLKKIKNLLKNSRGNSKELLEEHLDLLNNKSIQQINKEHPQLSYEDLKLIYFLQLKLTTKEIADRLGLSLRGTETKRYRLRTKLKIQRHQSLQSFLANYF